MNWIQTAVRQFLSALCLSCVVISIQYEKKRSERRKHCALAVVGGAKNFRPAADPLPGGAWAGGQNLISWKWSLPAPIDLVW